MPVLVVGSGFLFNVINAYVNARFVSHIGEYGLDWLGDPRFLAGLAIFLTGLALNIHSDNILLRLRKADEAGRGPGNRGSVTGGYAIPHGGAFRWVSCPNYLGELLEWGGWALATWSLGGLAFLSTPWPTWSREHVATIGGTGGGSRTIRRVGRR